MNIDNEVKCTDKIEKYSHLTRFIAIKNKRDNNNESNHKKLTLNKNDDPCIFSDSLLNESFMNTSIKEKTFDELNDNENISIPYEFLSFKAKNRAFKQKLDMMQKTDLCTKITSAGNNSDKDNEIINKNIQPIILNDKIPPEDYEPSFSQGNQSEIDFGYACLKVEQEFVKIKAKEKKINCTDLALQLNESFKLIDRKCNQTVDESFDYKPSNHTYVLGNL